MPYGPSGRRNRRRGTIIPLLAICTVALFGFIALAVDLGVLMVARTECQNAADTAALTGARTLDNRPSGSASYYNNRTLAEVNARKAVTQNVNMNKPFKDSTTLDPTTDIESFKIGLYDYDTSAGRFYTSFPASRPAGKSWSATEVVVRIQQETFFARVFGINTMPVAARAVAVHRPRDIALVLDHSGSMANGTKFNWALTTWQSAGMLNPDNMYPKFGNYSRYEVDGYQKSNPNADPWSWTATGRPHPLTQNVGYDDTTYGNFYAPNNFTVKTPGGPSMVRDFFYDPANLGNPATPATPLTVSGGVPNLRRAFHQWSPAESGGNPTSYTPPTYDFGGYDAFDTTGTSGAVPAPANFDLQGDLPIPYVGDKWPRKRGAAAPNPVTAASWDARATNGAAVNLAEYLGWSALYSTGTSLANKNQPPVRTNQAYQVPGDQINTFQSSVPTGTTVGNYLTSDTELEKYSPYNSAYNALVASNGISTTASAGYAQYPRTGLPAANDKKLPETVSKRSYRIDWSDFRDATWERYGYDLDVAHYIANRNNGLTSTATQQWDPRWDAGKAKADAVCGVG